MIRDATKIVYSVMLDFETRAAKRLNVNFPAKVTDVSARFGREISVGDLHQLGRGQNYIFSFPPCSYRFAI